MSLACIVLHILCQLAPVCLYLEHHLSLLGIQSMWHICNAASWFAHSTIHTASHQQPSEQLRSLAPPRTHLHFVLPGCRSFCLRVFIRFWSFASIILSFLRTSKLSERNMYCVCMCCLLTRITHASSMLLLSHHHQTQDTRREEVRHICAPDQERPPRPSSVSWGSGLGAGRAAWPRPTRRGRTPASRAGAPDGLALETHTRCKMISGI